MDKESASAFEPAPVEEENEKLIGEFHSAIFKAVSDCESSYENYFDEDDECKKGDGFWCQLKSELENYISHDTSSFSSLLDKKKMQTELSSIDPDNYENYKDWYDHAIINNQEKLNVIKKDYLEKIKPILIDAIKSINGPTVALDEDIVKIINLEMLLEIESEMFDEYCIGNKYIADNNWQNIDRISHKFRKKESTEKNPK